MQHTAEAKLYLARKAHKCYDHIINVKHFNKIMSKLISFDFAIKYMLRDKGNYDIVEAFISALLKEQGYKPVKIIAILDTESNREEYSQKKSLADLIVEDEEHTKYIIEIERQEVQNYVHKSCFNTSRLIVDQVSSGTDYTQIKKVFHISLLYFKIGNAPIYHGKTIIREIETDERLNLHIEDSEKNSYDPTDVFPEYIFISIPQFDDEIRRDIDEWLYVMKNEDVRSDFKSPYMKKVAEKLNMLRMDEGTRNEYIKYRKGIITYKDAMDTAISKAEARGEARGEAKGKAEGKARGEAKGKAEGERKKSLEVARRMLNENMDLELISRITGMSLDDILKLK